MLTISICVVIWWLYWLSQDWKFEKKSSDIFVPNDNSDNNGGGGGVGNSSSDLNVDEEAPLISSRLSHIGRTQFSNHTAWFFESPTIDSISRVRLKKRNYKGIQVQAWCASFDFKRKYIYIYFPFSWKVKYCICSCSNCTHQFPAIVL